MWSQHTNYRRSNAIPPTHAQPNHVFVRSSFVCCDKYKGITVRPQHFSACRPDFYNSVTEFRLKLVWHSLRMPCLVRAVVAQGNTKREQIIQDTYTQRLTPWSRVVLEKLKLRSGSQEITRLLCIWNVHYHVHKSPPVVSILSQKNATHSPKPYSLKIRSNIILLSTPGSSDCSLPFKLPNQNFVSISHLPDARYMSRPSHPPWYDHPNVCWKARIMELLIVQFSQFSPPYCHFIPLKSTFSPQHPVLKHPQSVFFL
jgi:hypothetical protein